MDEELIFNPPALHRRRPLAAHGYRLGPDIHPSLLDAGDPKDRKEWNRG